MSTTRSVAIASSDRLWADAVSLYLDSQPGWRCAAVYEDGLSAMAGLARAACDRVLATEGLPRLGAVPLARQVRRRWPATVVVVVGGAHGDDIIGVPATASAADVLSALEAPGATQGPVASASSADGMALLASLTKRELTVLRLLATGFDSAAIAGDLGVSEHTVRTHVQNLYAKLNCHSKVDIVMFAMRHGVIGGV